MSTLASRTRWRLSDRDWSLITKHVPLRAAARGDVEEIILLFRRQSTVQNNRPTAIEVRKRWEAVSAACKQVVKLISKLTETERVELVTSNFYWGVRFGDIPSAELEVRLENLLGSAVESSKAVVELIGDTDVDSELYSRKIKSALDALVQGVDRVLGKHGGPPVSRSKPINEMIRAIVKVADPTGKSGSIDEAVRRYQQGRGGLHPKKQNDPPQKRRRKSKRAQ